MMRVKTGRSAWEDYNSPTKKWWEPWTKSKRRESREGNGFKRHRRGSEPCDQGDIGCVGERERENIGRCPSFQTSTLKGGPFWVGGKTDNEFSSDTFWY